MEYLEWVIIGIDVLINLVYGNIMELVFIIYFFWKFEFYMVNVFFFIMFLSVFNVLVFVFFYYLGERILYFIMIFLMFVVFMNVMVDEFLLIGDLVCFLNIYIII